MTETIVLPIPQFTAGRDRRIIQRFAADVSAEMPSTDGLSLPTEAMLLILRDLRAQGWVVEWSESQIHITPPSQSSDRTHEKLRVQLQERLKRDEQLSSPSVRRFVTSMEAPRLHEGRFVSIFTLMRDGNELSRRLRQTLSADEPLTSAIDPYLQFVGPDLRCEFTGLRLMDVWRYFRHTWSNQYVSTPGRSMAILVRDRAAADHPIVGIASIGSAIVQLSERDRHIGWDADTVLDCITAAPRADDARWMLQRLEDWRGEIFLSDLVADGLYREEFWAEPSQDVVSALMDEASSRRLRHQRLGRKADFSRSVQSSDAHWEERAVTDLYRSKRCELLADLLRCRHALRTLVSTDSTIPDLAEALKLPDVRRAVRWIARRSKAETVGTEIVDITVCGAIAPYNHLLGGKLVSSLLASPTLVRAYTRRYGTQPSEIASSIAGRAVVRPANLVFLGTTSLYGAGASQYNRIRVPASVLGSSDDIRFRELGRSRSFGPSHLSQDTVDVLTTLAERSRDGARVKSIFGEGASPKLRRLREGLDLLQWPSNELLQHRRERIVYGVSLVEAPQEYLLRRTGTANYLFDVNLADDIARISQWWTDRWLRPRLNRPGILEAVEHHSTRKPIVHGARVCLPPETADGGVVDR